MQLHGQKHSTMAFKEELFLLCGFLIILTVVSLSKCCKITFIKPQFSKQFSRSLSLSITSEETSMLILNWILKLSKLKLDRNISVTIMAIIKSGVGGGGLCLRRELKYIHCTSQNLYNAVPSQ